MNSGSFHLKAIGSEEELDYGLPVLQFTLSAQNQGTVHISHPKFYDIRKAVFCNMKNLKKKKTVNIFFCILKLEELSEKQKGRGSSIFHISVLPFYLGALSWPLTVVTRHIKTANKCIYILCSLCIHSQRLMENEKLSF